MRRAGALALAALLAGCGPRVGAGAGAGAGMDAYAPAIPPAPPGTPVRTAPFPREVVGPRPPAGREVIAYPEGCGVEAITGASVTRPGPEGLVVVDAPVVIAGWAFAPPQAPGIPELWLRLVPLDPGAPVLEQRLVPHAARPDVVAGRSAPGAAFSGFADTLDAPPRGRHRLELVFATPGGHWACTVPRALEVL